MRLLFQDPSTGLLRLRLETSSDLWRAARLIRAGDLVGASTTRRDPEAPEDSPAAERDRRRIWLVVRAEQVEFHGFSKRLRVTGPIVEGPFDHGRHHTLDLGEGDEFSVTKERLSAGERALLEEGLESRGDPALLLAVVDWGDSAVVRLRGRVVEPVADLRRSLPGKRYAQPAHAKEREKYVDEILGVVRTSAPGAAAVVVAGPGFLKEEVARRLREEDHLAPTLLPTSVSGRAGVDELLRSGRATGALQSSVTAEESRLVEELLQGLAGRRAAIGSEETRLAIEAGAADLVLVLDTYLPDPSVSALLDRAREARARLFIVQEDGEPGRRLKGIGGIAARLRYDWDAPGRRGRR